MHRSKDFYDTQYSGENYSQSTEPEKHSFYPQLLSFIETYHLQDKKCLEVGCGRGVFQDLVSDYVGIDLSGSVGRFFHKPFYVASANKLPFPDDSFDAIWTYAVLEHIPDPESALFEMQRVLKRGGLLLLAPAWQCRPWAAEGYPVRPYSDFGLKGKLIKASIPLQNSVLFRSTYIFPRRLIRTLGFLLTRRPTSFQYELLKPNYDHFWMSDSDAVNSMDPYEAVLWFVSRGAECVSYQGILRQVLIRSGAIIFRICKKILDKNHCAR